MPIYSVAHGANPIYVGNMSLLLLCDFHTEYAWNITHVYERKGMMGL